MKKRIMAMLLALCMVLSICVPIAVADDEQLEEKAVVPECRCIFRGQPLRKHSPLFGICDRQNFCKEEINTTVSHMVYNWADYPDDVKTYLVELLTGDEAYAEKYAELQKELKLEDNRPQITVEDKSPTVGGYKPSVSVEGQTVRMDKYAKATLSAGDDTAWQICIDTTSEIWQWADITGGQGSLTVSYGLIGSLLTEKNGEYHAYLRAYRTYEDGEAQLRAYSKIYTIVIDLSEPDLSEGQSLPTPDFEEMTPSDAAPASTEEPAPAATETDSAAAGANAVIPASLSETGAETGDVVEPSVTTAEPKFIQPVPAFPQADDDVPTTYVILINYQFEDGTQAAPSWSATVAAGSTYTQDIPSPVVVGYTPNQAVVHVEASETKTYTVTYQPAEVDFTVKHYQQNIANDEYTLVDTETKNGYTESVVGDKLAKTDDGFYALLYDTTTKIAADGSTVVEIYYDRSYYLMNFALDGGYGVEPVYAKYGTEISIGEPTKPGYTFEGWDKEIPTSMPAGNTTITAQWKAVESTKVTIVVWGENPDDEKYSFYKDTEVVAKPGEKLTVDNLQGKLVCGKEEHQHDKNCFACSHVHDLTCYGLGTNASSTSPNDQTAWWCDSKPETYFEQLGLEDGYLYYDNENAMLDSRDNYYLRLNGQYYKLTNTQFNKLKGNQVGKTSDNTSGSPDYYYKYTVQTSGISCTHTHTDSCYSCGKEEHTHTSACYFNNSFMENPDLWRLVKSDEVTVAADGTSIMNVYYDRVEFTLHFRKAYSSGDDYGTIKAKWGQNIRTQFQAKCEQSGSSNWSRNRNASGPWTSYLDIMPTEERTYYANTEGYGTSTAYYYVEGLDGKDVLFYTNRSTGTGYTVTEEEFIDINGFTFNASRSAKVGDDFDGAKFYYTRVSYELTFYNYKAALISGKGGAVKYEAPLKDYDFTPAYPEGLEPNAYQFAGWYSTAGCYAGSEVDLNSATMPAGNLALYAKWVPVKHTVTFYLDKTAYEAGKPLDTHPQISVAHGSKVDPVPATPENGKYTFVGWFYMENGQEKAFNFEQMEVRKDLNVYAKWSSNTMMTYTVKYELKDGTEIAPPTTDSALAGSTKTFNAKTGDALNEGYQSGYFPETSSHSITVNIEDPSQNTYTFVYVPKAEVAYRVQYLEKGTGNELAEPKTVTTSDAVVTETFKQISGYAPDAYQKQLVLSADEDQNIITFWYVKDAVHAPVQIIHWVQNIAGDGYAEYQSSTNVNGVIGTEYSEEPLTIAGFRYNGEKSNAKGTLTAEGLVLNLYYDRIEYPYAFRFLKKDTEETLANPVEGNARYQAQVTQTAKTIPGYTLVSAENQSINIAIEDGTTAVKNVKIFYYTEQTVDIKYEVVGPNGCGTLDNYQDAQLKVMSGAVKGSTPTAADGFKFAGWFKDEACTQPVDAGWVEDNKLTPQKTKDYGGVMGYEAKTYYAKFAYDVFDLTVSKSGADAVDENQTFIFLISGEGVKMEVVVHGNSSVTVKGLKVGTYTVTELTDWSWRYKPDEPQKTVSQADAQQAAASQTAHTVEFVNTRTNTKWLNGAAYCDNRWNNSATVEIN